MVESNVILCVAMVAIYAVQVGVSVYRERRMEASRDNLIKIFRNRETDLLNRLMADSAQDFLVLNGQDAQVEASRAQVKDEPSKVVEDLLEQTGMGHDGFSNDGVAVG